MSVVPFHFCAKLAFILALLPLAAAAQTANKSIAPVPPAASSVEKGRARHALKILQPRAPVAGQPFDDREIELYIETEGRKLLTADRIKRLAFTRRSCALKIAGPGLEPKLPWPVISQRAEAATLVLGEFYREGKAKDYTFSVAAGAFLVNPAGICVTSLHVAKDHSSRGFCAMTRDGRVFPVRETLACDPVNDLVILQLDLPDGTVLPSLPVAFDAVSVGSPIVVMSHPDERFYMLTNGTVSRHTVWRDAAGDQSFMTITADFAKGSSGCPVLDERGVVVGVVNNSESIYYDDDGRKRQTDLQMVVKNTTPGWIIRNMLTPEKEFVPPRE